MEFVDKRALNECKSFNELDIGDCFHSGFSFYIKVSENTAFNIRDNRLEKISPYSSALLRKSTIIFE